MDRDKGFCPQARRSERVKAPVTEPQRRMRAKDLSLKGPPQNQFDAVAIFSRLVSAARPSRVYEMGSSPLKIFHDPPLERVHFLELFEAVGCELFAVDVGRYLRFRHDVEPVVWTRAVLCGADGLINDLRFLKP
jgi:hypothetical protein